jgi:hypothetical protein
MKRTEIVDAFVDLLTRREVRAGSLSFPPSEILSVADDEGVASLVYQALAASPARDVPAALTEAFAAAAREQAAREMLRRQEIASALAALDGAGVAPIVLKGAALAYTVYDRPDLRPRDDTDLLVREDDLDRVREAMASCGYEAGLLCDGELLFRQYQMEKSDRFGTSHVVDVHWKISTQPVFADVLSYDEVAAASAPIPALGRSARGCGAAHGLLIAAIHPVMHHRNVERLVWLYDVHLLASGMSGAALQDMAALAMARRVGGVTAHTLARARARFGTAIPAALIRDLEQRDPGEPSRAYLAAGRHWSDELGDSLGALPTLGDRLTLVREVMLPSPRYMRSRYQIGDGVLAAAMLPALYVHRLIAGGWKVIAGRK